MNVLKTRLQPHVRLKPWTRPAFGVIVQRVYSDWTKNARKASKVKSYYVAGAGRVCVNSGVCKCANSHRSKQTRKAQPKSLGVRSGVCSPVWSVSRYARAACACRKLFCRKLILMGPRSPGVPRGVSGVSGPSRLSGPLRPNVRMLTSHRLSSGVRVSCRAAGRKFSHLGPLGTPWDPLGPPLTPIDPWDPCDPLGPLCDPLGPL